MIICTGTIETPNGVYTNPDINIYFLSYSKAFGVMAYPQILAEDSPVDQLTPLIIDGPNSDRINRVDIENAVLIFLQNEYPQNQFTYEPNN